LIIAYKFSRAGLSALAAALLVGFSLTGITSRAEAFVHELHEHAATEVSIEVTGFVLSALARRHLWLVLGAVCLDAAVIFVEGFALLRNWAWGTWLVCAATAVMLPFEVVAIVQHLSVARVALFLVNLAIAAYLLARAIGHHRLSASK
jgi:uncharacterized membrane protein (DUF2068 family)